MKIYYFVHGTTTDNEKDIASGWRDVGLSKKGINQAKELGNIISHTFDAVFCSDLKRAVDSAHLAFGSTHIIIQDKRLRECNYGDYNGKPSKEFKEKFNDFIEKPFPHGESFKDVEKRVADFLSDVKKKYPKKTIAILAHQAPQLALEVLSKGKTWEQAINEDWRKKKAWQPRWTYFYRKN